MRAVDRSPARLGRAASVGAGLLALLSVGLYSPPALAVGGAGLILLVVALFRERGSDAAVTVGASGLFAGAILAGARGAPVAPVLVSATAAVVAWDVGSSAIGVGEQLGRDADTRRLETVHATASVLVGAVTAGVGYGLYRAGTGGRPVAALALLVVAAVLLVEALD